MPAALDARRADSASRSPRWRPFGSRRSALRRSWYDIDDDPVLLCECADGEHTC